MTILERINLALEAMLEKAEQIYHFSPENYPARGDRRGIAVVAVLEDPAGYPYKWLTISDNFGEICHRAPKQQNGRNIDNGGSNEGILFGKIAYSRRTGLDSGCDVRDIKEGESFWKGNIFGNDDKDTTFGFSGFTELEDEEVSKVGRETFYGNLG